MFEFDRVDPRADEILTGGIDEHGVAFVGFDRDAGFRLEDFHYALLGVPVGPARPQMANPDAPQMAALRAKLNEFQWLISDVHGTAKTSAEQLAACGD